MSGWKIGDLVYFRPIGFADGTSDIVPILEVSKDGRRVKIMIDGADRWFHASTGTVCGMGGHLKIEGATPRHHYDVLRRRMGEELKRLECQGLDDAALEKLRKALYALQR